MLLQTIKYKIGDIERWFINTFLKHIVINDYQRIIMKEALIILFGDIPNIGNFSVESHDKEWEYLYTQFNKHGELFLYVSKSGMISIDITNRSNPGNYFFKTYTLRELEDNFPTVWLMDIELKTNIFKDSMFT